MNTQIIDGLIIDTETGEVVGLHQPFEVTDKDSLNWVLGKMADIQGQIAADDARLAGYAERINKQKVEKQRRLDWLMVRFGAQIEEVARKELEGGKKKTLTLDEGEVSFRATSGSVKVVNEELALGWAYTHAKDAVKVTEKVLVSAIPENLRESLPVEAFEVTGPGENVSIKLDGTTVKIR